MSPQSADWGPPTRSWRVVLFASIGRLGPATVPRGTRGNNSSGFLRSLLVGLAVGRSEAALFSPQTPWTVARTDGEEKWRARDRRRATKRRKKPRSGPLAAFSRALHWRRRLPFTGGTWKIRSRPAPRGGRPSAHRRSAPLRPSASPGPSARGQTLAGGDNNNSNNNNNNKKLAAHGGGAERVRDGVGVGAGAAVWRLKLGVGAAELQDSGW